MAVRIEFHPSPRRRRATANRPPGRLVLLITTAVVGAHLLFWLVGIIE
jgi:hypothetical protein